MPIPGGTETAMNDKAMKRSRIMYIMQAALEYFVSILVVAPYLATLTTELGISDSLAGVISSIINVGCIFQLCSVFLKRKRVKGIVVALTVVNQLLFLLLYLIPLMGGDKQIKIVLFIAAIFTAYLIYYCIHPLKANWLMSLVDDNKRGIFTSWKEIVSLISGMIYSFVMGSMIDRYREAGDIRTAFILCGVTIFVITILQTLTLVFSVEPEYTSAEPTDGKKDNPVKDMFHTLRSPTVLKITLLFCLWYVASNTATPFYGTYLIKELGFSLTFISVLNIIYSVVRACVSTFWGKFADRHSFARMYRLCLVIVGAGFLVNVFTVPSNGVLFYTVYYILFAVAQGGLNSALINLVFDYVGHDMRSNALAVSQALSGIAGFFTTLAMSRLVSLIQENGNTLFGIPVYAQQVVSALACVFTIVTVIYVTAVVIPLRKNSSKN